MQRQKKRFHISISGLHKEKINREFVLLNLENRINELLRDCLSSRDYLRQQLKSCLCKLYDFQQFDFFFFFSASHSPQTVKWAR